MFLEKIEFTSIVAIFCGKIPICLFINLYNKRATNDNKPCRAEGQFTMTMKRVVTAAPSASCCLRKDVELKKVGESILRNVFRYLSALVS